MSQVAQEREEYLHRLLDLLPSRETRRVRTEVEAMILDHMEAAQEAQPDLGEVQAQRGALAALGDPEDLAEQLVAKPLHIPLAIRRRFTRALAVLFASHLLLSIVLTVAGATESTFPSLLGPLPVKPAVATILSVLGIFFLDAGLLLSAFWIAQRSVRGIGLSSTSERSTGVRKTAWQGVVLVGLLALILNVFLEAIFAIRSKQEMVCFLSTEVRDLLHWGNLILGIQALRSVVVLLGARAGYAAALDAAASLLGAALLVLIATRPSLVTLPTGSLGTDAAATLGQLLDRVLLFVCLAAALYLVSRGVARIGRAVRLLRS